MANFSMERDPGSDHTAVLVSDRLNKLQTKRNSSEGAQICVSEPEAIT